MSLDTDADSGWEWQEWDEMIAFDMPEGQTPLPWQEVALRNWLLSELPMRGRGAGKSWLREVMRRRIERLEGAP